MLPRQQQASPARSDHWCFSCFSETYAPPESGRSKTLERTLLCDKRRSGYESIGTVDDEGSAVGAGAFSKMAPCVSPGPPIDLHGFR